MPHNDFPPNNSVACVGYGGPLAELVTDGNLLLELMVKDLCNVVVIIIQTCAIKEHDKPHPCQRLMSVAFLPSHSLSPVPRRLTKFVWFNNLQKCRFCEPHMSVTQYIVCKQIVHCLLLVIACNRYLFGSNYTSSPDSFCSPKLLTVTIENMPFL